MDAPSFISKEQYDQVLLKYIQQFRDFLKGKDESVISKDLHQTMNSRFVYLSYLWSLVPQAKRKNKFEIFTFLELVEKAVCENNLYKKGTFGEDAATYMLGNIEGWKVTGRRVHAGVQE